ncbi:MAG: 3-dehydroquinate synthase [Clostridiales Family XIII bacterium]|jgi:3-dehydroquinate synthase|nr:3-dehydroquinate synthase [Clostridiales Family XIII bacterium]
MRNIRVNLAEKSYDILLESGILNSEAGMEAIAPFSRKGEKLAVVSDRNVRDIYGEAFIDRLRAAVPGEVFSVAIRPGEESKNLDTLSRIFDAFAEAELGRRGLVIALGGGVAGDIAGFAAACWMRGVRHIQIPTSLLAMVDSSVGGKTAVDIPAGKNLVGAFHQPSLVLVDPKLTATLPAREFASGMGEIIKYGTALSEALFRRIGTEVPGAFSPALESMIAECICLKRDVVEEDEFESGRRKLLNFGHSFGHAIEVKTGFSAYSHGAAVAAGMRIAARFGERAGVTEAGTAGRVEKLLAKYNLNIEEETKGLAEYMKRDKKAAAGGVSLVLLKRIGEAVIVEMGFSEIEKNLASLDTGSGR